MIIGKRGDRTSYPFPLAERYEGNCRCTKDDPFKINLKHTSGVYTLYLEIEPDEKSNFAIVQQNGEEIGAFAIPYTGNIDRFGRYQPIKSEYLEEDRRKAEEILCRYEESRRKLSDYYVFAVPCIIREELEIIQVEPAASCLNNSMMTYNSEGFFVRGAILARGIEKPDSLFCRMRPGKNLVDLWGWMSMTSFEHPADRVTSYEEQAERGIRESYAWGANNFEFLPINADGVALDLSAEEEWDGKEIYRQSKDTVWTADQVRRIVREAKKYGMMTEFFLYCLHGAGFIAADMNFMQKVNLFEKIVKNYSNYIGEEDTEELVDGIITEAWFPIDGPLYLDKAWKWNPGLFHLISNNDGSQYEVHNTGYTPATHAYSAHWPGFDTQHTGYDHSYPLIPYPADFYSHQEGTLYTYMQGCGQTCHPRKKYPRVPDIPLGITNRTVSPDWIIAQAHNYGLRNLWEENDHLAMALCWEADEQTMCPGPARRYVYAASQDPVKLASCYRLEDTGAGGELELKRNTRKFHHWDQTRLRKRSKYPASSTVNGNRFLQMVSLTDRDETILQCDLAETGTFYNHGAVADLGFPFLATRFRDNRFLEKRMTITESAGPVAVMTEESRMGSGYVTFHQSVRYEVYSDIPAVFAKIERTMSPGLKEEIQTILGLGDYGHCEITEREAVLTDPRGILPDAIIWVEGVCERMEWVPGHGVVITSLLRNTHSVNVTAFFRMGDFVNADPRQIKTAVRNMVYSCDMQDEIRVKNRSELAMPIFVKIRHTEQTPYYVMENGIWQHRGGTFLEESPGTGCVKLYLKAGEEGRIRRYGYLNELVKPGRGSQNILGIHSIEGYEKTVRLTAEVDGSNPMLQAAILETRLPIKAVKLDGNDYRYFHNHNIYLPQGKNRMKLEIEHGINTEPLLQMSYSKIIRCTYNSEKEEMRILVEPQPWMKRESESKCRGIVWLAGKKLCDVKNCEIIEQLGDKILLEWSAGEAVLKMKEEDVNEAE